MEDGDELDLLPMRTLRSDGLGARHQHDRKDRRHSDEHEEEHDLDPENRALLADHVYPPTVAVGADERSGCTYTDRSDGSSKHRTPLPYAKILPLAVSRMSEGLIFSVILPYINEMIHGLGVPEQDVGVWSATAVS
jgi:hypothetical protein